jgi:capsid protein
VPVRRVRGRFDSAATTEDNRRHWANADALSADAAASPAVRRTLRNRARYEVANNSYARGIVLTLANDTIGTGPRLQMLTKSDEANDEIEHEFDRWAHEVSLAEKLRTMRMARAQDGEAFAILVNNPVLDHAVKLDLRLIEADQVATPDAHLLDPREVDGIVLDGFGNPVAYHVLKNHPGNGTWGLSDEYRTVPASHVIHVFRQDRPGQHRGIPEITPALPLFAQLRRFTLAVLGAAEAAADFAGILYTDAPANGEAKEASAQETRLKNHTTTLAHEYSKQGRDWQDALRQRGKEVALMRELGLTDASAKPAAAVPARDVEDLSPEEMEEAAHALSD